MPTANESLAQNLRLLCSQHRSISEVCRKMRFNRQQFNKYLGGQVTPSRHNLRRISDFFGLEEFELFIPHGQFAERLKNRQTGGGEGARPGFTDLEILAEQSGPALENYLGYYFTYYYSFSAPGNILKSLLHVFAAGERVYYKRVERLIRRDGPETETFVFKYRGVALYLRERIFMIDYESLLKNEVSETVLYPTYKNRVSLLPGIIIGVSGRQSREPACSRVVLEYLGRTINAREALRACGLFSPETDVIEPRIKQAIRNTIAPHQYLFRALPL